jgi:hypothetical protein
MRRRLAPGSTAPGSAAHSGASAPSSAEETKLDDLSQFMSSMEEGPAHSSLHFEDQSLPAAHAHASVLSGVSVPPSPIPLVPPAKPSGAGRLHRPAPRPVRASGVVTASAVQISRRLELSASKASVAESGTAPRTLAFAGEISGRDPVSEFGPHLRTVHDAAAGGG